MEKDYLNFTPGWLQIPNGYLTEAKKGLKDALNVSTNAALYNRKNGKVPYTLMEKKRVEEYFNSIGITKNIWK